MWRFHKVWSVATWALMAGIVPVGVLAGTSATPGDPLPGGLILVGFMGIVVGTVGMARIRCPRCHQTFYRRGATSRLFAWRCVWCDQKRWTPWEP